MAAQVRVVHACPDAPAVDIWVDGQRALTDLSFGHDTGYVDLPAGSHQVAISPAGSNQVVFGPVNVSLNDGVPYTVIATGLLKGTPSFNLMILQDMMMRRAGGS